MLHHFHLPGGQTHLTHCSPALQALTAAHWFVFITHTGLLSQISYITGPSPTIPVHPCTLQNSLVWKKWLTKMDKHKQKGGAENLRK